jgi:hypothetical protein
MSKSDRTQDLIDYPNLHPEFRDSGMYHVINNMKKVNRVLKLGVDKCEYEVVYDSTDTDSNGNTTAVNDAIGYFTAVFTKDATGCSFSPSQVTKSTKPIITTVPNTKTANIAFSF